MASNSALPTIRWPFTPFWELDGFDFSMVPAHYSPGVAHPLHQRTFTTGISHPKHPSISEYCRMVANNVAVQFRAMLYDKDAYPSPKFWTRVRDCGLRLGTREAEVLGELFVQARRAYLQSRGDCPNEPARLVDEWIAFLDSGSAAAGSSAQPLIKKPWHIRFQEWNAMVRRGELMDRGYALAQQAASTSDAPSMNIWPSQQPPGHPLGREGHSPDLVVKREEDQEQLDDASAAELHSTRSQKSLSKRKRKQNESPRASRSRSPKRRARKHRETDEPAQHELQSLNLSSPPAEEQHPDNLNPLAPAEHESTPPLELIDSPPICRQVNGGYKSTKTRVAECEEALAYHIKLIHGHDSRLSTQEELTTQHTADIENLESRLKSVEEAQSLQHDASSIAEASVQQPGQETDIDGLRESVSHLTERLKNRESYIRAEVKKQLTDVHAPLEQEQKRLDKCLDKIRDDLATHKVRIEDCKKAVSRRIKKAKQQEADLNDAVSSLKRHRARITKLTTRVTDLEEKLAGKNTAQADSEGQDENEGDSSQIEDRLTSLNERIAELERKQETVIDKMLQRLDTLESGRATLEKQVEEHGARLTKQEQETRSTKNELTNMQSQLRNTTQAVPSVPGTYTDYYRTSPHNRHHQGGQMSGHHHHPGGQNSGHHHQGGQTSGHHHQGTRR